MKTLRQYALTFLVLGMLIYTLWTLQFLERGVIETVNVYIAQNKQLLRMAGFTEPRGRSMHEELEELKEELK